MQHITDGCLKLGRTCSSLRLVALLHSIPIVADEDESFQPDWKHCYNSQFHLLWMHWLEFLLHQRIMSGAQNASDADRKAFSGQPLDMCRKHQFEHHAQASDIVWKRYIHASIHIFAFHFDEPLSGTQHNELSFVCLISSDWLTSNSLSHQYMLPNVVSMILDLRPFCGCKAVSHFTTIGCQQCIGDDLHHCSLRRMMLSLRWLTVTF